MKFLTDPKVKSIKDILYCLSFMSSHVFIGFYDILQCYFFDCLIIILTEVKH